MKIFARACNRLSVCLSAGLSRFHSRIVSEPDDHGIG
jgi:hypothetical protein